MKDRVIVPLIVDTFSLDETSPIVATDSEHKLSNVHILHSLVSSYSEITVMEELTEQLIFLCKALKVLLLQHLSIWANTL